tara:strand:+ start:5430 stop:6083 length:654 start_codon:yes stop_codon:yes gene_type:complete
MKKFIIIGSGDHAKVIANELLDKKKFLGFVDVKKSKIDDKLKKYYLGDINFFCSTKSLNYQAIIGIGRGDIRRKIVKEINQKKIKVNWGVFISEKAVIMNDIKIGEGSVVLKGCVISNNCKIGKHCHFNTGTILDHNNTFKDFTGTGPGVVTGGNVHVDLESFIGIGSTVKNNIFIKTQTIIGSGSVVVKSTRKKSIYFGNPATFKRTKKNNENYFK